MDSLHKTLALLGTLCLLGLVGSCGGSSETARHQIPDVAATVDRAVYVATLNDL